MNPNHSHILPRCTQTQPSLGLLNNPGPVHETSTQNCWQQVQMGCRITLPPLESSQPREKQCEKRRAQHISGQKRALSSMNRGSSPKRLERSYEEMASYQLHAEILDKRLGMRRRAAAAHELFKRDKQQGIDKFVLLLRSHARGDASPHIENIISAMLQYGRDRSQNILLNRMFRFDNDVGIIDFLARVDLDFCKSCLETLLASSLYPEDKKNRWIDFITQKLEWRFRSCPNINPVWVACASFAGCLDEALLRDRIKMMYALYNVKEQHPQDFQKVFRSISESKKIKYEEKLIVTRMLPQEAQKTLEPLIQKLENDPAVSHSEKITAWKNLISIKGADCKKYGEEHLLGVMERAYCKRLITDEDMFWRLAVDDNLYAFKMLTHRLRDFYSQFVEPVFSNISDERSKILKFYSEEVKTEDLLDLSRLVKNKDISQVLWVPVRERLSDEGGPVPLEIDDALWNIIITQIAFEVGRYYGTDGHYNQVHDWFTELLMQTKLAKSGELGRQIVRQRIVGLMDLIMSSMSENIPMLMTIVAASSECPDAADQGLNRLEWQFLKFFNDGNDASLLALTVRGYMLHLIEQESRLQNSGREAIETFSYNSIKLNGPEWLNLNNRNNEMLYGAVGVRAKPIVSYEGVLRRITKASLLEYMTNEIYDSMWYRYAKDQNWDAEATKEASSIMQEKLNELEARPVAPAKADYDALRKEYEEKVKELLGQKAELYLKVHKLIL